MQRSPELEYRQLLSSDSVSRDSQAEALLGDRPHPSYPNPKTLFWLPPHPDLSQFRNIS